jgi:hypothetical protein
MTDFSITNTNLKVSDVYSCIYRGSKQTSFLKNINILNLPGSDTLYYKVLANPQESDDNLPNPLNMYTPYDNYLNSIETYFDSFDEDVNTKIYVYRINNIRTGLGSCINTIKFTDSSGNSKTLKSLMFIYEIDEKENIITNNPIWTNSTTNITDEGKYTPETSNINLNYTNIYSYVSTMPKQPKIVLDVITTSELININICYTSCYDDSDNLKFN